MSDNLERIPYRVALNHANPVVKYLRPLCSRIEIAGSLRRKKETIGDIEIVLIPIRAINLLGEPVTWLNADTAIITSLVHGGFKIKTNGPFYKQVYLPTFHNGSVMIDLFLTTPEKWGCVYTIRTGSAEFSKKLVTKKSYGGVCPDDLNFKNGRLWRGEQSLETPEELDVFKALGMQFVNPEDREV